MLQLPFGQVLGVVAYDFTEWWLQNGRPGGGCTQQGTSQGQRMVQPSRILLLVPQP